MYCMFPLFTLFLRYQKFFTLKENYVRRSCNYDRLILSWLTYYFRSSTIVSIVYCKYSAPSRQNLDVFWDFEFSWRLLLSLSSSSSSSARASSAIHDHIMPPIAILQQSREVVWKASRVSTELVDVGDCRVIVSWQKMDHNMMRKKKLDNRVFTIFQYFDYY